MHWPSRKPSPEENSPPSETPGGPSDAAPVARKFSAPPAADAAPVARKFSAPPAAPVPPASRPTNYDSMDFSKYSSSIHESDGLQDAQLARRSSLDGQWIQSPRLRQCFNNIQLGAKMGASVGGCFGLLTGAWVAITQRNLLVLPVSVIGGAVSFGFFLGCGMIIRCEEQKGGAMVHSQLVSVDASTRPRPLLGATGVSFAPLVQALRRHEE
ncbi:unnamed protein product [Symbiodinium microadriaticum]|nr:unnamed protein product [Symbiodinium microadriaticum]